jgi:hypothetical protein
LLHETCNACVTPTQPNKGEPGDTTTIIPTVAPNVIAFRIEHFAEAADPVILDGLTLADVPNLATNPLTHATLPGAVIGAANVRVSTYRNRVLLSLVELKPLKLAPGVYEGNLDFNGAPIAVVRVTVVMTP